MIQTRCWYDPSDIDTLAQDQAGTVPVTAVGQAVGRMRDKSGHGMDLVAFVAPVLRQDAGGNYYLEGDGVATGMQTERALDLTNTNQLVTMAAATSSDVGTGIICESNPAWVGYQGTYALYVGDAYPACAANGDAPFDNGLIGASPTVITDQSKHVYTASHTITGNRSALRVDGVEGAPGLADKGQGPFSAVKMDFMTRDGSGLWLDGGIYQFVLLDYIPADSVIQGLEKWCARKMGVTL
jgi:hypothetical protein